MEIRGLLGHGDFFLLAVAGVMRYAQGGFKTKLDSADRFPVRQADTPVRAKAQKRSLLEERSESFALLLFEGRRSGFTDRRSRFTDRRSGFMDRRSGFMDWRFGFMDRRSGFTDRRSGFMDWRFGLTDSRPGLTDWRFGFTDWRSGFTG
jgi:hypothetical protein